ncbi:hypothetical protein SASPL_147919 [Salvia splendens]|uniref:Uncharacterized protein n=1 Tax=Salvia splendens TaxID=180675 RepID=A0A8X8Z757_SALSN|nr:hypothetical protein SASPL_147919 [Salvia splendens]
MKLKKRKKGEVTPSRTYGKKSFHLSISSPLSLFFFKVNPQLKLNNPSSLILGVSSKIARRRLPILRFSAVALSLLSRKPSRHVTPPPPPRSETMPILRHWLRRLFRLARTSTTLSCRALTLCGVGMIAVRRIRANNPGRPIPENKVPIGAGFISIPGTESAENGRDVMESGSLCISGFSEEMPIPSRV